MLKHKLKEAFKKKDQPLKVRGEISGTHYGEIKITSFDKNPLNLMENINSTKFSFQALVSGAICFSEGPYRLDNHHNSKIHQHISGAVIPAEVDTLSGALRCALGNDFDYVLENLKND